MRMSYMSDHFINPTPLHQTETALGQGSSQVLGIREDAHG